MALQTEFDRENNKKVNLTPTGIFLQSPDCSNCIPEKIIEIRGTDFYIMDNQEYEKLVGVGGSLMFKVHTMALKMILKYTNKKHIYVTLPTGMMKKVKISRLLNGNKLMYFKTSGIDKFAYCTYSDVSEMKEEE
jgi:hypothetical protein